MHEPAETPRPRLLVGVLSAIRKNPRAWIIAAATAAMVVLGGGSFALGAAVGSPAPASASGSRTSTTLKRTATATPTAPPRPTATPIAPAARLRTCSVAGLAKDGRLGTFEGQVLNAKTGEVLFDRSGSTPAPTASVMKILTASAALATLGANYRIPTTVVKGTQPGQVVLIGGGDVTLSRTPSGSNPFYQGAAHLDQLAAQVKQAWAADPANQGKQITSLVVDSSLFSGPVWLPSWDEHEERIVEGSTAYVTALQVDGDRDNPYVLESSRGTDPVGRAANAFASDLGGGIRISDGKAPAGAKQLGQVLSPTVSTMADQALTYSDNTIMETLARLVAIKTGSGNTFAAENAGTVRGLASYGISTAGIRVVDGSGLSDQNRVPPSFLTRLMVQILNRQNGLGMIYDGLPVSGETGTLAPQYGRFQGDSSIARGKINAKTGWINGGYTLAGVVHSADGTPLTFAVFALGDVDNSAMEAIDSLAAGFYRCGGNLSNY
jgi:D-alanyl-D-alanine carboxypeptidase (penicillin-binding protein 4)